MIEDEMVVWHHQFDGHEFEQAPRVGDRQGSLVCCSPWGRKESDTTEWLNWTELNLDIMRRIFICDFIPHSRFLWGEKGVITRAGLLNTEGGNLNTLGTICKWRFFTLLIFGGVSHIASCSSAVSSSTHILNYWAELRNVSHTLWHFHFILHSFSVTLRFETLQLFAICGCQKKSQPISLKSLKKILQE